IAVSSSTTPSTSAVAMSHLEAGRLGHELEYVEHLHALRLALFGERSFGPRTGRDECLHPVELLRLGDAAPADLCSQLALLEPKIRARARAVGPLRDAIDVDEVQTGNRAQDLARRLPDPEPLAEATRVVIGDGPLDRSGQLELAVPDLLGDQVDREHDLELV